MKCPECHDVGFVTARCPESGEICPALELCPDCGCPDLRPCEGVRVCPHEQYEEQIDEPTIVLPRSVRTITARFVGIQQDVYPASLIIDEDDGE